MPIHGEARHLIEHRKFALSNGVSTTAVVENGEMLRLLEEYDCGLNYQAGNSDSLLLVMRTLLEVKVDSLESMKKNALKLYSDKFDRSKINASLTRFIEQL